MIRVAPFIAQRASLSRRQAEQAILQGRVSRQGAPVTSFYVEDMEGIALDGQILNEPPEAKAWIYHKPAGQLVTRHDPQGRPTVWSTLRHWMPEGPLVCAGRLDALSEGLLIATNHPPLAHLLETSRQPRVYRVWVSGLFTPKNTAILRKGIIVDDIQYRPIRVVIEETSEEYSQLKVTLTEGKKREIRIVMDALGHPVTRLLRLAFGPWTLHDQGEGTIVDIPSEEIQAFLQNTPRPEQPPQDSASTSGSSTPLAYDTRRSDQSKGPRPHFSSKAPSGKTPYNKPHRPQSDNGRVGERSQRPFQKSSKQRPFAQRSSEQRPFQKSSEQRPFQKSSKQRPFQKSSKQRPFAQRSSEQRPFQRSSEQRPMGKSPVRSDFASRPPSSSPSYATRAPRSDSYSPRPTSYSARPPQYSPRTNSDTERGATSSPRRPQNTRPSSSSPSSLNQTKSATSFGEQRHRFNRDASHETAPRRRPDTSSYQHSQKEGPRPWSKPSQSNSQRPLESRGSSAPRFTDKRTQPSRPNTSTFGESRGPAERVFSPWSGNRPTDLRNSGPSASRPVRPLNSAPSRYQRPLRPSAAPKAPPRKDRHTLSLDKDRD